MKLKLIEEGLITIYESEKQERLVNAREIHNTMKIGKDFTTWIKDRIDKYEFKNNEDYILTFPKIGERRNVVKHDYYLTIDTAKEIAMIENNAIGRQIRKYFIEVEKKYREITTQMQKPNDLLDIMQIALDYLKTAESKYKVDNVSYKVKIKEK